MIDRWHRFLWLLIGIDYQYQSICTLLSIELHQRSPQNDKDDIPFDNVPIGLDTSTTRTSCVDIMAQKGNDRQVGISSTCAMGYILCAEKTGLELFY